MKRISDEIKQKMIQEARDRAFEQYGETEIFPAGSKATLDDSFTIDENNIIFWYNVRVDNGMTTLINTHQFPNIKGS
jgi:hypothetical protein